MKKILYLKTKPKKRKRSKQLSFILMICGFLLVGLAIWPILSFNLIIAPKFASMVNPVPDNLLVSRVQKQGFSGAGFLAVGKETSETQEKDEISFLSEDDSSKASFWFPEKPTVNISQENGVSYTISIPKLKIKDANVVSNSDDLSKSLIQYVGTAHPGDYGNSVIFGHSVLPYFFNPKDYKTIFSTLPSLSEGDEILVNYEGITYKYLVEEMRVVNPNDVSILEQRFDDSYLSLVTCVPPGTYEKRLWVKARIEKI